METLIGLLGGALISWALSHRYYRRSARETPHWAKRFIESLPDQPIPTQRLVELYHAALDSGEIGHPDPIGGYVACPKCGASSDEFEPWEATDFERDDTYRGMRCGRC